MHLFFLEISTSLGDTVIRECLEYGVVCTSVVEKGVFTTSVVHVVDIDHNSLVTTAS
jgi:hypothetical protein